MPVTEGMIINHIRKEVMELLLINHLLNCRICDLQDQIITYEKSLSRFEKEKRAVKDKYLSSLVAIQPVPLSTRSYKIYVYRKDLTILGDLSITIISTIIWIAKQLKPISSLLQNRRYVSNRFCISNRVRASP